MYNREDQQNQTQVTRKTLKKSLAKLFKYKREGTNKKN